MAMNGIKDEWDIPTNYEIEGEIFFGIYLSWKSN